MCLFLFSHCLSVSLSLFLSVSLSCSFPTSENINQVGSARLRRALDLVRGATAASQLTFIDCNVIQSCLLPGVIFTVLPALCPLLPFFTSVTMAVPACFLRQFFDLAMLLLTKLNWQCAEASVGLSSFSSNFLKKTQLRMGVKACCQLTLLLLLLPVLAVVLFNWILGFEPLGPGLGREL